MLVPIVNHFVNTKAPEESKAPELSLIINSHAKKYTDQKLLTLNSLD